MENNTNSTSKSKYISTNTLILQMKIAFANAKLPNILPQLQTLGYTEEKFNEYLEKINELEELLQVQKKEYGEQYAETEKVNKKREEIDEIYKRHLAFCKILFKGNVQAISTLGLNIGRKNAYAAWFQQVNNFYGQLLNNSEFLEKVSTINIQENDLKAQQNALVELTQLKENQKKEIGQAQKATEMRDEAFDKIYPIYTEFVSYAKILFQNDQTLEALGIVVKNK
ncbi:hypothetical protein CAPN002_08000 [Capnocytophaga stomatis]|uniref:hypothetical protein n=1 Tax=Capnocytophaga stomatis TaxID=1848904 RepID=UPI001950574F|nr:hypothetical protein [Capnocytophaga stomatis]GIJ93582.1 hypothetical protein CAPN002_08000 [Capnocytophaga stomatis]GIM50906.1 hypothetical protein CAPN003_23580 [Capnocytophaga stomatis]